MKTGGACLSDNIVSLGAALAFYTTLALAPLLVVAIAAAGIFFNRDSARQRIIGEVTDLIGSQAGTALQSLRDPTATTSGEVATAIGVATLLFGVFGVFQNLQSSLNSIWRAHRPKEMNWRQTLRQRFFSWAAVVATGFLMLVSLVASAVLSWAGTQTIDRFRLPLPALDTINAIASFAVITILFAIIFKLLPDTPVQWRHVWLGSAATAGLFTAGKGALGYYLRHASITSAYGAAGSLVVLLLWCYYAAQIVFFGAELTRVVSLTDGGRDFAPLETPPSPKRPS